MIVVSNMFADLRLFKKSERLTLAWSAQTDRQTLHSSHTDLMLINIKRNCNSVWNQNGHYKSIYYVLSTLGQALYPSEFFSSCNMISNVLLFLAAMSSELMVVVIISCVASLVSMVTVLLLCACCYRRGNDSDTESLDDADYYTRLPQDVK